MTIDNFLNGLLTVAMFSQETIGLRRKLRQAISDSVGNVPRSLVYDRLKDPFAETMTLSDLAPFCESIGIAVGKLPFLLKPYGVSSTVISPASWMEFYEDEIACVVDDPPIPQSLTTGQINVLLSFINGLRRYEPSSMAVQWIFLTAHNPEHSPPAKARISAFCHAVDELGLSVNHTDLIDALLSFFGRETESIEYQDFALLMQTFNESVRWPN